MKHFLVLGSVLSPRWFSHLILTITLEDNSHFAEEEVEEKRVTELASDQGRAQPPRAEAPDIATSALTYSNFWLFMEKHESASHFHSHELDQSPQGATSPRGMTSGHQRAFNQTSREMKPVQGWHDTGPQVEGGIFSVASGGWGFEICH